MNKYYIGIDPGISGGLACIGSSGVIVDIIAMPTMKVGKKNKLDIKEIAKWIKGKATEEMIRMIAIEEQRAMHKQGVTSTFTTGRSYGLLEGVVAALELPYSIIRPLEWQKAMFAGLPRGNTKEHSKQIAQQLYPGQDFKRTPKCSKIHDGLTDATLIAEYIRRKIK